MIPNTQTKRILYVKQLLNSTNNIPFKLSFYGLKHNKTCVKRPLSKDRTLVFKTNYRLMQVKVLLNAPWEHSAIILTFTKLPFAIKIFVLSIFEWLF